MIRLQLNLLWWYIIIGQSVLLKKKKKRWIAVFKVKVTVKDQNVSECFPDISSEPPFRCREIGLLSSRSWSQRGVIWSKYDCFCYIFGTAGPFAIRLGFMVFYYKAECLVKKKKRIAVCKVKVTAELQTVIWTAETFITKFGMVMHHHLPECHAKRFVCCLQSQGHSKGSSK